MRWRTKHRLREHGRVAEPRCRAACASYVDDNGGFGKFDRALIDGNLLASFDEVLDVKVNRLAQVCERLPIGMPPSVTTLEGRTEAVPSITPILEFVGLNADLKDVGFHKTSLCRQGPAWIISRRWWLRARRAQKRLLLRVIVCHRCRSRGRICGRASQRLRISSRGGNRDIWGRPGLRGARA